MILVDTDVMIDVQRGHVAALEWFAGLTELPIIPGLVYMELIQGAKNQIQIRDVESLVKPLPIAWPTERDCERALSVFSSFHLSHSLGLIDALIGSMAVGLSAELCTFNAKHYRSIPNLIVIQPYAR